MNNELIINLKLVKQWLENNCHDSEAEVVDQSIAALSAKPESERDDFDMAEPAQRHVNDPDHADLSDRSWLKPEMLLHSAIQNEPAKPDLPEVEAFIQINQEYMPEDVHGIEAGKFVVSADLARTYLQQLTAAHKAGLEKYKALDDAVDHELVVSLESTLDSYDSPKEALNRLLAWTAQVALDPAVSREAQNLIEQGRGEALQSVPVLVLSEVSGFLSGIESLTRSGNKQYAASVRTQIDAIDNLIESARAAQSETVCDNCGRAGENMDIEIHGARMCSLICAKAWMEN